MLAIVLFLLVIGAIVVIVVLATSKQGEAEGEPSDEGSQGSMWPLLLVVLAVILLIAGCMAAMGMFAMRLRREFLSQPAPFIPAPVPVVQAGPNAPMIVAPPNVDPEEFLKQFEDAGVPADQIERLRKAIEANPPQVVGPVQEPVQDK